MFSYSSTSILYLYSLFSLLYLNQSYTKHVYIYIISRQLTLRL